MQRSDIDAQTTGRWPSILAGLGVAEQYLRPKQGPCPMCEGKTRYRFDDKEGRGTWICNHCGAGNGIGLVMRLRGVDFKSAVALVREVLPDSAAGVVAKERSIEERRLALLRIWDRSTPVMAGDPVDAYLSGRGLKFGSAGLRCLRSQTYYDEGRKAGVYDAMVAVMKDKDGKGKSLHLTYLLGGRKAPVESPRKIMQALGTVSGCAVRLEKAGRTLGVAEGIETALAASVLFGGPVWAVISANGLASFQWPEEVRKLSIYADHDESFAGQRAAYTLAERAKAKGLEVEVVMPEQKGQDWLDALNEVKDA